MNKIFTIYKATNLINNKVYIGFDSNWPHRKRMHKSRSKSNKGAFYQAINKYGWNNFVWEVIYQSKDRTHTLEVMEPYFITEYNSYLSGGYNMTKGGDGVDAGSIPWNKGLKLNTPIWNKGQQIWYDNHPNLGRQFSEEWKNNISRGHIKHHYKLVSPNDEIIIVENLKKFAKENNLNASHLYQVSIGNYKQSKGWRCERIA